MILYMDTFVTDEPLTPAHAKKSPWGRLREADCSYRWRPRLEIFKYTLASYVNYTWSNVYIRYKLENPALYEETNQFIKGLFPSAIIENERSDKQQHFAHAYRTLRSMGDKWIFYSPNNDHPIMATDLSMLDVLVEKGNQHEGRNRNLIGLFYSHFDEFIHLPYPGNWFSDRFNNDREPREIIDEDENTVSIVSKNGDNTGIQIVHIDLFKHWFLSWNLDNHRIIRPECLRRHFKTHDQISVMPKREICAHYDGQPSLKPESHPPLFVPEGFFDSDIKIRYGFSDYVPGWVNINPNAEKYSFEDNINGTDIKKGLDTIPLFWQDRISEVVKNESK